MEENEYCEVEDGVVVRVLVGEGHAPWLHQVCRVHKLCGTFSCHGGYVLPSWYPSDTETEIFPPEYACIGFH